MDTRLIATAAVTAALASALSVGATQLTVSAPAQAHSAMPTDSQLLAEIADNTATANSKLHVLGQDLNSVLSEEKKVYADTNLGAKRLRYINSNLVALYRQVKTDFTYRDPYRTKYTTNEMTLIEQTLCDIVFWTQDDATGSGTPQLPPCGK